MKTNGLIILLFISVISCKHVSDGTKVEAIIEKEEIVPSSKELDYITGHFDPEKDERFVEIPEKYADRPGMFIRKEVLASFVDMWHHAMQDSIHLVIRSATRNFDYQKGIWERKWTGQTILSDGTDFKVDKFSDEEKARKILEYSSMPGTSRHHWGTDLDFNSFENSYFEKGYGLRVFKWLEQYAEQYHFCRPYTEKNSNRPHGYNEEKWHWSFMPISKPLTMKAKKQLNNFHIKGFLGADQSSKLDVVRKYVLGIDKTCQ